MELKKSKHLFDSPVTPTASRPSSLFTLYTKTKKLKVKILSAKLKKAPIS
jgi:hypothetical protein